MKGGFGGYYKNRILLVPNLDFALANKTVRGDFYDGGNFCQGPAPPLVGPVPTRFTGTLAITANANTDSSSVQFFDVTDPTKPPCMAG